MNKIKPVLPERTEFKTLHFERKTIDQDQGIITGYLSTFGNVDLQGDRVIKGAFSKTISEAKSRKMEGRKFLWPVLWMHDPEQPIGLVIDAKEDDHGLLITAQLDITTNDHGVPNNPKAVTVFSGFKQGYVDELSMGYIAIQKDYDRGVRDLKECAVLEASGVTGLFAANPEALVPASGVKSIQTKAASGKTTWPLASHNTKWDGGQAAKDIEEWADGDWSKVAQCFFWVAENPPAKLEDCKLPFVAKDGDTMKAIPQGIISCAGVIQGAMGGVDLDGDEDAVKKKIATYYKKMDMTPPWEDDGKRRAMNERRKDFNDLYQATQAQDCLEDWGDILNTFTQAMIQLFSMGDQPKEDMQQCLDQLSAVVLDWTDKGMQCGLAEYLSRYSGSGTPYVPYSLRIGDDYGYMSRRDRPFSKAGRTISAATQSAIEQHQSDMKDLLDQHKSMVTESCKAIQQKVSDLTQLWADEGQGPAYGNDDKDDDGKSWIPRREPRSTALTREQPLSNPLQGKSTAELTVDDLAALLV